MWNIKLTNKMRNRQLEHELERIATYDKRELYIDITIEGYYLNINDNFFYYSSIKDLVLDCIELSKRFDLVFV